MIQTTAKKHKSTLVVLFGVSALCVVAPATADQVDQAVTEILERPVELHAPTGIYMPDEAQSRKFIDEHGVDIKSMQDRVARARAEQEQTLGIRPDQRVIERPKSRLMVFVSTSIPRESLNRLIDDAGRAGAVLMINGMLGNNLKETKRAVHELNGERKAGWSIDSPSFRRFNIKVVPTVILSMGAERKSACEEKNAGSCMEERFYGVEGDVTLSHALNHIIDKYPEGAKEARVYLSRMSGKGGMEP